MPFMPFQIQFMQQKYVYNLKLCSEYPNMHGRPYKALFENVDSFGLRRTLGYLFVSIFFLLC
jgi:hypothetical protein